MLVYVCLCIKIVIMHFRLPYYNCITIVDSSVDNVHAVFLSSSEAIDCFQRFHSLYMYTIISYFDLCPQIPRCTVISVTHYCIIVFIYLKFM